MTNLIYWGEKQSTNVLRVAVPDIYDELALERIRVESGMRLEPVMHTEAEIRQMIRSHATRSSDEILESLQAANAGGYRTNTWESEPIINLVDSLIDTAIQQQVTDIHLEPDEDSLRIRFRKDGLLQTHRQLPGWITESVLIRLKLLACVDITERRLPHDGSFSFEGAYGKANIRLSTLPVQIGEQTIEKCVLRVLPAQDEGATLESLHFSETILKELRRIFKSPQGLFLITGPTGSGKTTTLYAGLREIIVRKINVTTIEDPVEYKLQGANQVQVNDKCGFTFAAALRSILRQDPDVILVGEIRDAETAQIAIRAAQTGHLVLATLHTNSARAAETRLADLGISHILLEDSLLGVVAQRLVRKREPNGGYKGRTAIVEFLKPDGTYVDGDLHQNAARLVQAGVTDEIEIKRTLG